MSAQGLGITPPRGWRSWNAYTCTDSSRTNLVGGNILTGDVMRAAMHAVLDDSRALHNGSKASLASLGFDYVSMDDGWQQCNCSTRQAIDPALPNCSISMCVGGECSWHDSSGAPQVNAHRFPEGMKKLVDYGHSLGLKVGSYLNNCICMCVRPRPRARDQAPLLCPSAVPLC